MIQTGALQSVHDLNLAVAGQAVDAAEVKLPLARFNGRGSADKQVLLLQVSKGGGGSVTVTIRPVLRLSQPQGIGSVDDDLQYENPDADKSLTVATPTDGTGAGRWLEIDLPANLQYAVKITALTAGARCQILGVPGASARF